MAEHAPKHRRAGANDGALINGALIALGALAVVDNVVFHWLLGFHRFNEAWGHETNLLVEAGLVLVGIAMVAVGVLRQRAASGRRA